MALKISTPPFLQTPLLRGNRGEPVRAAQLVPPPRVLRFFVLGFKHFINFFVPLRVCQALEPLKCIK